MLARGVLAVLVALLVALQLRFWFGDGGFREQRQLRAQLLEQGRVNAALRDNNQRLYSALGDGVDDLSAVEAQARRELGMVRRGETFYWIVDER